MPKYEVQEETFYGWENTWSNDDGPTTFDTREDAEAELNSFLADMAYAVSIGDMEDCPSRDQFRIVEVQQ